MNREKREGTEGRRHLQLKLGRASD